MVGVGSARSDEAQVRLLDHHHGLRPGGVHSLIAIFRWNEVANVATVVGAVSSLVGTAVGAFFGVQFGSAGRKKAEAARDRSQEVAEAALSMLPPESAEHLRSETDR